MTANKDGVVSAHVKFPGSCLLYLERNRQSLRANDLDFKRARLEFEVKVTAKESTPVVGNIFLKDKDGIWFQSQQSFKLSPGEWHRVGVSLLEEDNQLQAIGHTSSWNSHYALNIHTLGISLYGNKKAAFTIACKHPTREGERQRPPLAVRNWQLPRETGTYQMLESTFSLSREYFNPFDPDEITVDVEAVSPDGKSRIWPAFYTQDFVRKQHFNREIVRPAGKARWAFRFTPPQKGDYKLRLLVNDKSAEVAETLITPWKTVSVGQSDAPGFVMVNPSDSRYFQLTTGEFFYPIGFNIHTAKDLRSERRLDLGYIPDRGTYAYEEYFSKMKDNGINACEIWMASWTLALEWTSAHRFYYGLCRYNLANAWKLDRILADAKSKGIYIHLVLDNHGKLSSFCDQEWLDSPFNSNNKFADADGAFLDDLVSFFSSNRAQKVTRMRNRYIAGRWGQHTNIMGFELWSEVNLTLTNHSDSYKNHELLADWHQQEASYFHEINPGGHLVTTHCSGDYNMQIKFQKIYDLDEIDYVVGDAYRSSSVPFVTHMQAHQKALERFGKPVLITEYGGTPHAGDSSGIIADLHAGLWSSFFCEQAGTPFLWWHEFIHTHKLYKHFRGFAAFMKGLDPRNKSFTTYDIPVYDGTPHQQAKPYIFDQTHSYAPDRVRIRHFDFGHSPYEKYFFDATDFDNSFYKSQIRGINTDGRNELLQCLVTGNTEEIYGWVSERAQMVRYKPDVDWSLIPDHYVYLPFSGLEGPYRLQFFDTISGKLIGERVILLDGRLTRIKIPAFRTDIAFKLIKIDRKDSFHEKTNEVVRRVVQSPRLNNLTLSEKGAHAARPAPSVTP